MRCKACKKPIKKGQERRITNITTIHNTDECFDLLIKQTTELAKRVREEREKKQKKKIKHKTSELKLTQITFNKYIRTRDTMPDGIGYCISCGARLILGTKNCQAGHYKCVGERNDLRFNEDNCHAQCLRCNHFSSGEKWVVYRENLCRKIGIHKVHILEDKSLIEKQDFSDENLKKIRKEYARKTRLLTARQKCDTIEIG